MLKVDVRTFDQLDTFVSFIFLAKISFKKTVQSYFLYYCIQIVRMFDAIYTFAVQIFLLLIKQQIKFHKFYCFEYIFLILLAMPYSHI